MPAQKPVMDADKYAYPISEEFKDLHDIFIAAWDDNFAGLSNAAASQTSSALESDDTRPSVKAKPNRALFEQLRSKKAQSGNVKTESKSTSEADEIEFMAELMFPSAVPVPAPAPASASALKIHRSSQGLPRQDRGFLDCTGAGLDQAARPEARGTGELQVQDGRPRRAPRHDARDVPRPHGRSCEAREDAPHSSRAARPQDWAFHRVGRGSAAKIGARDAAFLCFAPQASQAGVRAHRSVAQSSSLISTNHTTLNVTGDMIALY